MIEKIVSGGQTGADRAALDVALERGFAIGGWVPKGRLAEDGPIPPRYTGLREAGSPDPAVRTVLNVRDSDATLIVSHGPLSGGSLLTCHEATRLGRPLLHLDLAALGHAQAVAELREWLRTVEPATLNVAGPRASRDPAIAEEVAALLRAALPDRARLGPVRGAPSLVPDAIVFLGGGALVAGVVWLGVPALSVAAGVDSLAAWMALATPLVFTPIFACGWWILRGERAQASWIDRLRLRRPTRADWLWGLAGLIGIGAASAATFLLCSVLGWNPNPPFARGIQPLASDRLWMLGLWVVYWPLNILAEEFVWRGVSLPRMEARLGERAWALNAALWGAFHTAFGPGNLLVLLPTLILIPWIAQRRRNTWLAVLMHAGLSLPGFVALALGTS